MKKKSFSFILIASIILITGCTNQAINNTPKINNFPAPVLDIQLKTDKEVYHSQEKILLTAEILSDQDLDDVIITAAGITNSLNRVYFNQSQKTSLTKNSRQQIKFSQILPNCNSCSGLSPGNYTITVSAYDHIRELAQKDILIQVKQ